MAKYTKTKSRLDIRNDLIFDLYKHKEIIGKMIDKAEAEEMPFLTESLLMVTDELLKNLF